jgi:hypothetical protein
MFRSVAARQNCVKLTRICTLIQNTVEGGADDSSLSGAHFTQDRQLGLQARYLVLQLGYMLLVVEAARYPLTLGVLAH